MNKEKGVEIMPTKHTFHLKAHWQGGRQGEGTLSAGNLQTKISIPKEMDGPGIGTNPDEMLIGAAATCYLITLAAMMERREIPVAELTLETVGVVSQDKGLKFESITHKPRVVLGAEVTEEQIRMVERMTEQAEKACMISNALRGNVELGVEGIISVEK
jgi:peroxiredoxin-like protein